jgi:hypothetical protein
MRTSSEIRGKSFSDHWNFFIAGTSLDHLSKSNLPAAALQADLLAIS